MQSQTDTRFTATVMQKTVQQIIQTDGVDVLSAMLAAQRSDHPELALCRALDAGLASAPGHRLLTVLAYYADAGESQRIYSSRLTEYPMGGRKTLAQAPRMNQVLASGRPYIGRNRQDIIENFADHQTLLAMGCESIVNMPVRWGTDVLGTVNLLHGADHYSEADLPLISTWAQLLVPAFLSGFSRR